MRRLTDKYHLLQSFCSVVEHQSFTKAATQMGISASSISKNIQQLESEVGQVLLLRTTRSMALTDAGEMYYKKGKQLLKSWQDLDDEVAHLKQTPSGKLSVTLPVAIGQSLLTPIITKFMKAYPTITIELKFTHKAMNLIDDDFDVAIRTWKSVPDTPLYKTDLLTLQPTLVAAPEYIAQYGAPANIEDLTNHKLLIFNTEGNNAGKWHFSKQAILVNGQLCSNDYLNLIDAAKQGVGIANVYSCICQSDLRWGNLIEILPSQSQLTTKLSAFYRQQRTTSAKLHCFLEFLENALAHNR